MRRAKSVYKTHMEYNRDGFLELGCEISASVLGDILSYRKDDNMIEIFEPFTGERLIDLIYHPRVKRITIKSYKDKNYNEAYYRTAKELYMDSINYCYEGSKIKKELLELED